MEAEVDIGGALLAAARTLAIDRVALETVTACRAAGIEAVLLKGATLAAWLYPDDLRPYGDIDLLVAPERIMDAAGVLERLGFQPVAGHVSLHAHPWVRISDGASVDLHVRLYGIHYAPARAWPVLRDATVEFPLSGGTVQALGLPGRALQVALHAAQHRDEPKPREDLRRALAVAPAAVWQEAERLADRIGALPTMAIGLGLEAEGRVLIDRLALLRATQLAAGGRGAGLAVGLARLAAARGLAGKSRVVADSLRRPVEDLRGEPGAALLWKLLGPRSARAWHAALLVVRAPRALWALNRRRREARRWQGGRVARDGAGT